MSARPPHAAVVGLGLIGASAATALVDRGWRVAGTDIVPEVEAAALANGTISEIGLPAEVDITLVATPVAAVPAAVDRALRTTTGVVTDVAGVKGPVVAAVDHPRFVAGHPMAGSEQDGFDGRDPDLFRGAVWVLCPTSVTADASLARASQLAAELGAEVLTLDASTHDGLVAVVSHVPHLTAATLMNLAADRSVEHSVLLRLAAGGFRDMTRVAAGRPGIWPDICLDNRMAIVRVLDDLLAGLAEVRELVAEADRPQLLERLEAARAARINLPSRVREGVELVELRVPIPDQPGVLARITRLATELDVNIHDLELAHSAEGPSGVLIMVVSASAAEPLVTALDEQGFRPASRSLT